MDADEATFDETKMVLDEGAAAIGHNSVIAIDQLKRHFDRLDRCQDAIDEAKEDLKEVLAQIKSEGYDIRTVRKISAARRKNKETMCEQAALFRLYAEALDLEYLLG